MKASVRCWNQNGHILWSFEGLRLWFQASDCCSDETLKTVLLMNAAELISFMMIVKPNTCVGFLCKRSCTTRVNTFRCS